MYVIGGSTKPDYVETASVLIVDPRKGRTFAGVPLPAPRTKHAACTAGSSIFVMGGLSRRLVTNSVIAFDTASKR